MIKKIFSTWIIAAIAVSFYSIPLSMAQATTPFSDVDEGDTHYVAITYLQEQGIINGYGDGTFRSWEKISRAEALKMMTLASQVYTEEDFDIELEEAPFSDTSLDEWYTKYIAKAKEEGIIEGYNNGEYFSPEETINLVEALKIYLSCHSNLIYPENITEDDVYDDIVTDGWHSKYVALAKSRDLLDVPLTNKINPGQEMTRGYMAEIIYRMKKNGMGYGFGKATFYGKAVQGNGTASGEIFDYNLMTAAHRTLPFGTYVEVTNLANGKSVIVKINDRGPYGAGRVIDLSSAAFEEIAWLGTGVINAQYKVITLDEFGVPIPPAPQS